MLIAELKMLLAQYHQRQIRCFSFFIPADPSITALTRLIKSEEQFIAVSDDHILRCFLTNLPKNTSNARTLFSDILKKLFPNHHENQRDTLIHMLMQAHYKRLTHDKKPIQASDMKQIHRMYCPPPPTERDEEELLTPLEPF